MPDSVLSQQDGLISRAAIYHIASAVARKRQACRLLHGPIVPVGRCCRRKSNFSRSEVIDKVEVAAQSSLHVQARPWEAKRSLSARVRSEEGMLGGLCWFLFRDSDVRVFVLRVLSIKTIILVSGVYRTCASAS